MERFICSMNGMYRERIGIKLLQAGLYGCFSPVMGRLISDPTDVIFCLALALLPAGGTVFGFSMMYWSPISPVLIIIYALLNVRFMPRVYSRYGVFMLYPVALMVVSMYGWASIGFHVHTAVQTLVALISGMACLVSLDIAFRLKHLDWAYAVRLIVVAYWVSFGIGVLEFLAVHGHAPAVTWLARRVLKRNYVPNHVQFLFAEPSYVGMHVFGVLMPLYWLTKRKRVAVLTLSYALGAAAMGVGVRILIDTVVALLLWLVVAVNLHRLSNIVITIAGLGTVGIGGSVMMLHNPRIESMLANGPVNGDFSAVARLFRALAPAEAWKTDWVHFLFGFGIGNLKDAIARGYESAVQTLTSMGGKPQSNEEIRLLGNPPGDHYIFTMSAYVDAITEFGLLMCLTGVLLLLMHITRNRAWNKMTVCWVILLVYLYIQFEGYAFYALWLFIWVVGTRVYGQKGDSGEQLSAL